jgi:ribosome-associated toxin RatA of RatAB toxin-antitoxin module
MKQVKKSVLLWYSAPEMYALVTGVTDYPKFLPWCEWGEVVQTHDDGVTARIHMAFAGLRHAFTTRNTQVPDREVRLKLVDGPFSLLEGSWRFIPLAAQASGTVAKDAVSDPALLAACRVEFELSYSFSSRALDLVLSPMFDRVANTFVDSFVRRAEQVYGAR